MITAALPELSLNLQGFLGKATDEDVLIMDKGHPVGVLRGFASDDDYQEYRLLNDSRFQNIVAESRREYREGKFTRLEDIDSE